LSWLAPGTTAFDGRVMGAVHTTRAIPRHLGTSVMHVGHRPLALAKQPRLSAKKPVAADVLVLRGGSTRWSAAAVAAAKASYFLLCFSTAAGAFSGTVRGGMKEMDIIGCTLMGVVVAVGGGTVRDLCLGAPVFWTYLTEHIYICIIVSLSTFMLWPQALRLGLHDTHLALLWADAVALASAAVIGAHISHIRTGDPMITIVLGLVTSLFGGIFCDVCCQQQPRVLYAERSMYATPALLGIALYVTLVRTPVPQSVVISVSFLASMITRVLAWTYRLRMPHWTRASRRFRADQILFPKPGEKGAAKIVEVEITTKAPPGKR